MRPRRRTAEPDYTAANVLWSIDRMTVEPMVPVNYEFVGGKHFFTAATSFGQGLCVAHSDLRTAHDEVGRQLKVILSENHQLSVTADAHPAAFEKFQEYLNAIAAEPACRRAQVE